MRIFAFVFSSSTTLAAQGLNVIIFAHRMCAPRCFRCFHGKAQRVYLGSLDFFYCFSSPPLLLLLLLLFPFASEKCFTRESARRAHFRSRFLRGCGSSSFVTVQTLETRRSESNTTPPLSSASPRIKESGENRDVRVRAYVSACVRMHPHARCNISCSLTIGYSTVGDCRI